MFVKIWASVSFDLSIQEPIDPVQSKSKQTSSTFLDSPVLVSTFAASFVFLTAAVYLGGTVFFVASAFLGAVFLVGFSIALTTLGVLAAGLGVLTFFGINIFI
jgi:hypothetical protein